VGKLRRVLQFFNLLLGIEDHDAKRAADRTSSAMRDEVQRMHETASQIPDKANPDSSSDEVDMFAVLPHDMRNEEQRRMVERGE